MNRIVQRIASKAPAIPRKKRVAAYARVSSAKDAMLHSLSAQVSYYSAMIQKHPGWEYAGVYTDEAMTGTKDNRQEFQHLLFDCRAGMIDMIIVKSISRFARNTVILLETVRELKELNIDVFFERENIHSISGDGELMLTILASFAQEESRSVSENCKWRIRGDFREGKPCTTPIYGYSMHQGELTVIPAEASVVQMIFRDCLHGMGKNAIMKKLNELNVPTRGNGRWRESTVEGILHNERYTGDLLLQKTFVGDHLQKLWRRNHGELPQYYVSGNHEPIIDRDIFDRVQDLLRQRAVKYNPSPRSASPYPFTKMILCAQCGAHYKRKMSHGKAAWNCSTFLSEGKQACHAKQIPEDTLLAMATDVLSISSFDATLFKSEIKMIRVPAFNHLIYVFHDGREVERIWQDKSRCSSWDDAAKQRAREHANRRYHR